MESYGLEMLGPLVIEKLSTLPGWTADDEGREIYVEDTAKRYYGDSTSWIDYATSGTSGTSIVNVKM